jgi:uncharacterized OB-fold protein
MTDPSVSSTGGPEAFPVPEVADDPATRPFWDGIRAGRLLLEQCQACQAVIWYPRGFCPRCGCADTGWIEASGRGTVYTYTVARRSFGRWGAAVPYVIAYVELAEGPRVLSNVVETAPDEVSVGMQVEVVMKPGGGAYWFRPLAAGGGRAHG